MKILFPVRAASPAPVGPEPMVEDIPQPARVMAVDRLEWIGDRLAILGPTTHPACPLSADPGIFQSGSDAPGLPEGWSHSGGRWSIRGGMAAQEDTRPGELSEARLSLPAPFFLLEVGVKALSAEQRHPGAFGLLFLDGKEEESFSLEFLPRTSSAHSVGKERRPAWLSPALARAGARKHCLLHLTSNPMLFIRYAWR